MGVRNPKQIPGNLLFGFLVVCWVWLGVVSVSVSLSESVVSGSPGWLGRVCGSVSVCGIIGCSSRCLDVLRRSWFEDRGAALSVAIF